MKINSKTRSKLRTETRFYDKISSKTSENQIFELCRGISSLGLCHLKHSVFAHWASLMPFRTIASQVARMTSSTSSFMSSRLIIIADHWVLYSGESSMVPHSIQPKLRKNPPHSQNIFYPASSKLNHQFTTNRLQRWLPPVSTSADAEFILLCSRLTHCS